MREDVELLRAYLDKLDDIDATAAIEVELTTLRAMFDEIDAAPKPLFEVSELESAVFLPHVAEFQGAMLCFLCINDARTAEALGREALPILPATTVTNGMSICDAEGRHRITVKTNSGLIVPEAQMPPLNGHGG